MSSNEIYFRALPYLDKKWLKADLTSALNSPEDLAVFWNNLLADDEISINKYKSIVNSAGNLSYLKYNDKYYCGAQNLTCSCCKGVCSESSACSCQSCQKLESEETGKKFQSQQHHHSSQQQQHNDEKSISSDTIFESWLWSPIPSAEQKLTCIKSLLAEQHEICLQSAGTCLSAIQLKQLMYVYRRYFIALARCKTSEVDLTSKQVMVESTVTTETKVNKFQSAVEKPLKDYEKATMGLARVGTRAALNFSFAFLRRAWKSGEDTELCSELLMEALDALQTLPEGSLFDTTQISSIWIEVVEKSIKFLRQVVLGDVMGGRCSVPKPDRHIALSLLLELGAQKGTLGGSLEGILLLMTLWEKDAESDDNRAPPQSTGAPLVPILRRYEQISSYYVYHQNHSDHTLPSSPTESFLRFLSLPDDDLARVDLKQAAVIIISHLDRLAKPHLPIGNYSSKLQQHKSAQQIFTLGWSSLSSETYGFTAEAITGSSIPGFLPKYSASTIEMEGNQSVSQVVCSETAILMLTTQGIVYVINSNASGGSTNFQPKLLDGFRTNVSHASGEELIDSNVAVVQIAAHCEGKHFLALTADNEVYSWGLGEGGRLGHGDHTAKDIPTKIETLSDKSICSVFCGATYSAAIAINGEIYTWGRGSYGRLGHGTSDDKLVPTQVQALKSHKVVDIALGSGDSHSLCVTTAGQVFAWGDGDFGKLGNGSSNGSQIPQQIEGLEKIVNVYSGSQFSVALSSDGAVFTWGKGHGGRLGHGGSDHISVPKVVEALEGKQICQISVGSAHCLALTSSGELYGWGRNDYQQICPASINRDPIIATPILTTPPSLRIAGVSCGPAQSIAWCNSSSLGISTKIPFAVDLSEHSFRLLDQLLCMVCGNSGSTQTGTDTRHPPNQEAECIAVACLNILRLQLHAIIANNLSARQVGLCEGSRLLASLKSRVLSLAGGPTVLKTMQEAAQWTLQVGWSVLLPTASERAQTLTALLPAGHEGINTSPTNNCTSGYRFMTDLLVGSLMAEGGLQTALNQAINAEPQDVNSEHHLPLLHLLKQLLRNNSSLSQARLNQLLLGPYLKTEDDYNSSPEPPSPSLDLLHKFQRLLLSHIHQSVAEDLAGAESVLATYLQHIVTFCAATLTKAHEVVQQGKVGVADVLKADISDTLLYELLIGLILLQKSKPTILSNFDWNKNFIPLLHGLDALNRVLCDGEIQDVDDMGWPGIICRGVQKPRPQPEEVLLIRKSDIENHILDGGRWIIINGNVYDLKDYHCELQAVQDLLQTSAGKDLTVELSATQYRSVLEFITTHLRIGKYVLNETDEKIQHPHLVPLTHFNSERSLAYLLGLRASFLQKATDLQPAEQQCRAILQSQILSGGLQVLQPTNPFDEEKGEARSGCSTAGSTPTEASNHPPGTEMRSMTNWPSMMISQRVDGLLYGLGEGRTTDPVVAAWIVLTDRYCKENRSMWHQEFTAEHTVMELERLLMAVLIRHQSLGPLVLAVIDRELSGSDNNKLPEPVIDIIKIVHHTKLSLIKMRQQLNRSYKEVCAPMLDKCRFLLYEIRPAVSLEQLGLKRLLILHKYPRFKTLVHKIIAETKSSIKRQMNCAKREDILNVTIQSQHAAAIKIQSQENLLKYLSNENLVKHFSIENLTKVASMENLNTRSSSPGDILENKHFSNENLLEIGSVVVGGGLGGGDTNIIPDKIRSSQDSLAVDPQKTPTNESTDAKQKNIDFTEQFINDVITKLSEKCLQETELYNNSQKPVINQIVDFVMQEVCDVETLRRAMYCQVQRYKIRKLGLEMFNDLLQMDGLLDAVQYNLYNGYLGLFVQDKAQQHYMENVLANLNMITAFQKADIILTQSRIIEWGVRELQKYINQEHVHGKQKYHCEKDNSNLGTYVFLKKLPRARFLLSIFGILTKEYDANELSLLINSGVLGSILGLLRQTGGDGQPLAKSDSDDLSVVYEDVVTRLKSSKEGLAGPELAKLMKIGTRVARGADWKWGEQDGPPPGEGRIISEIGDDGWVRVEWDTGATNSYRMGKEGQYDLRLADSVVKALSPDRDNEKDDFLDLQLANDSHPTKLLKQACVKMLQMMATSVGVHGDKMQQSAVLGISSMFRAILGHKSGFMNFGLEQWTTLGFIRATSSSKLLSKYLTSPIWLNLHIEIMEAPIMSKKDVYKKLHCIRLLQATLTTWQKEDAGRINFIVEKIFTILGRICLYCPNDFSLMPADVKSKVLFSASYSGTIAEEIISLIRRLHTLPLWNGVINSFLSQKLCIAAELFSQDYDVAASGGQQTTITVNDADKVAIMGALNAVGGCDSRPRLGLSVTHEAVRGTISGMTKKGQIIMNLHTFGGELKKIPIFKINENIYTNNVFSLSKLTMNEVLLNSWAVLMYSGGGSAGDEKNHQQFQHHQQQNNIETSNLRLQQIQLSVVKATRILFRHQSLLRKVLRQRSPGFARYTSDDSSLSSEKGGEVDKTNTEEAGPAKTSTNEGDGKKFDDTFRDNELLIQSILLRATQPSPLRACYTFQEMELAALNLSQILAGHVYAETSAPLSRPALAPSQPTLIHGIPIYNDAASVAALMDDLPSGAKRLPPCPLVAQIIEMGFTRKGVEAAIKSLTIHTEVTPTAEQIVQWILEHPDVNYSALAGAAGSSSAVTHSTQSHHTHDTDYNHSDSESISSDTVEGSSLQDVPIKYATREDFKTADQYAMYVRGLISPQMLVRCCMDFEEIRKGDVGTVLKVEPEGLHDLNVRVDWQMHDRPYWMCFVHLELLEPPPPPVPSHAGSDPQQSLTPLPILVGSLVKLRPIYHQHQRFRYATTSLPRGSVGVVQSISGSEVIVDFPQQSCWLSQMSDLEVVPQQAGGSHANQNTINYDIIEDWSRCIRSLTVSSNECQAKYLLTRSSNYWQSSSTTQGSSSKHWIRLEMHDNVLIQSLSITVDPDDCSHMPSLVFVRVGDTMSTLKEFNWVSINPTDTNVTLLSDLKQFYPWIEIVVKQCRNNGIQCRIHGLHVIGRRRQTDLDLMLQNAAFLATESDQLCEPSFSMSSSGTALSYAEEKQQHANSSSQDIQSKVLVWGLNDKEQLGGLKGSKVKLPIFSSVLSQLKPIHIAGGSKSLFIVSQDGKLYACGEGTNGRLGLGHNNNVPTPRQVPIVSQYVVKKVAVHSGGKHALALTLDGKVFSWGEGEDGKLGHGTRMTLEKPKMIETLRNKRIRDIACGSSHSACISSSGELYTWGLGEYGRLGHGDNTTQLKPKLVTSILGQRVVQVACGSRDAQTLCLTEDGNVFSWGDGDFGKLGRGGSEGCTSPYQIERLNGVGVIQIECGAQFSLALTKVGEVWTWGKGDYYRLGHGSDQHLRKPTPIQGLRGKKVIHVAVGALHCLAVTDSGQVFGWGDNDHGQQGSGNTIVNKKPSLVLGLDGVFVNRVACGSSHSVAWSLPQSPVEGDKKEPVVFAVSKDPLGGHSLGIYASDTEATTSSPSQSSSAKPQRPSLSETLLSLESYGARQAALAYVLKAMNIFQARSCVIAALTSHTAVNQQQQQQGKNLQSVDDDQQRSLSPILEQDAHEPLEGHQSTRIDLRPEIIAHGGGEGPADATGLLANDLVDVDFASLAPSVSSINPYRSLTGSMSLSASLSSCNATQKHSKMSASAMSVVAANMTHHEEMVNESLTGLDDFTSLLGESEARNLIELLKLSVSGRTGAPNTVQTIATTLIALGSNSTAIGNMLLETCITELEDLCTSRHCLGKLPKPVMQETSHPYIDDITLVGHVKIPGAEALRLEFDSQCSTEKRNDPLIVMDGSGRVIATRSGREYAQWAPEIRISGDEIRWKFTSDNSVNGWGWRFYVHAIMPAAYLQEMGSDRTVLSQPSMDLVMALLDSTLGPQNTSILLRLVAALAQCAQISTLSVHQRIWSLKKMHQYLTTKYHAPKPTDPTVTSILTPMIPSILRQYEYEEPQVRSGVHLMHSEYFKTLLIMACDMQLDSLLPTSDIHKWAWFRRYCSAIRVAQALIRRQQLPQTFCLEVRKKLLEMSAPSAAHHLNSTRMSSTSINSSSFVSLSPSTSSSQMNMSGSQYGGSDNGASAICCSAPSSFVVPELMERINCETNKFLYEDHTYFTAQYDSQLLQWFNRRPEDWAFSWGGASTIFGWGHNHRGQLGGLDGSRIKIPTPCEALSLLRPIQIGGGEQTLYAVTLDGKVYATGYGAGGRLGIGGIDSVSTPTLIESLQHVSIKKVAVNSGGKHALALSSDGEVFSFGEGEDGKLGHGNRDSYDRPKLIEALSGIGVLDIACGSAHSACITAQGHVLTWGKGRYGRLGHGDSEDQLQPKLVEALLGYRALDIGCGSGDAQTLCITDDDNVWSWGDGDYGKLGRGGSDGCKVPMKIESLAGLGVVKVECGSQFSVALTRSGSVYTWGKGDYHRLGHGNTDHVRRPKKVAALQGKKIISIATGSLHCVACTDQGEVFTWGDNDEGQLGDGTVTAIQRPRLVTALQGKHIVKVICGSAHTLALSTYQLSEAVRPPPSPPLEYDLVRDITPEILHARLVLLHHFSELICPCLAMLPINGELSMGALKDVLVYGIKETAFRKVIQTTMVRDKPHGPIIELNRIQVKRSRLRSGNGLAGIDGMKSVFGQMVQKLPLLTQESLSMPHRVWKVKFVGESVDDCGGGFSESIAEMCDELQNGCIPLLCITPNGRGEAGANQDCFLLDPTLNSVLHMNMFRFLGVLMGIACRTGSPLSLNLAEPVWRQLSGEQLRPTDLTEVDRDFLSGLICIRDMDDDPKIFQSMELPFSTSSARGHEVPLSTRYSKITPNNRHEYVKLALNYRMKEFDEQVKAVRDGMSKVIPVPLLSLFSASELMAMVCGSPDIPLGLLKTVATYKGVESTSQLVGWFWEVMEEFSNQERSLFLRFVWGRTRLPRTIADFRGRDFVLQVLDKYNPPDHFLPESYTCFFLLKMPRYSCKAVLLEKLKYAIHFCKSIDTDEYARVAIGTEATEATGSEDNSDIESIA